ncbi:MAG: hypothetical protein LBV60_19205 [Streptomyces sp.]|jgi:hypothetical protein|nr:hypothetical protein [Streptomyces sp.]
MAFIERHLRVPEPVTVAGRRVKRYEVSLDGGGVAPAVAKAAYAFLPDLLPPTDTTPPAAFTVLHESAEGAYLNVYSWVWDNVLHFAGAAAGQPALDCPDLDKTRFIVNTKSWIGCVWELPAVGHERDAWVRHMLTPDAPALDSYLADTLPEGPTGGAPA